MCIQDKGIWIGDKSIFVWVAFMWIIHYRKFSIARLEFQEIRNHQYLLGPNMHQLVYCTLTLDSHRIDYVWRYVGNVCFVSLSFLMHSSVNLIVSHCLIETQSFFFFNL